MYEETKVLCSGSFIDTLRATLADLRSATNVTVAATAARSIGSTADSIPYRLRRGKPFDLVICFDEAAEMLVQEGLLLGASKVAVAEAVLAVAVKQGSTVPALNTVDQLRAALLSARSIGYSASASGIYLHAEILPRLGIAEALQGRCRRVENERVGDVIARGECDLGFQQLSELVPCKGITVANSFPEELQKVTTIAAAVPTAALYPAAARQVIEYLVSSQVTDVLLAGGLRPVVRHA